MDRKRSEKKSINGFSVRYGIGLQSSLSFYVAGGGFVRLTTIIVIMRATSITTATSTTTITSTILITALSPICFLPKGKKTVACDKCRKRVLETKESLSLPAMREKLTGGGCDGVFFYGL